MKFLARFRKILILAMVLHIFNWAAGQVVGDKKIKRLKIVSVEELVTDDGEPFMVLGFEHNSINSKDIGYYNDATKNIEITYPWNFEQSSKRKWDKAYLEIKKELEQKNGTIKIGQEYRMVFTFTTDKLWNVESMERVIPLKPTPVSLASVSDPRGKILVNYFNQLINKNARGTLYLKSFKKVDGLESNINGVPHYSLDYIMEIEFLNTAYLNVLILGSGTPWIDFTANAPYGRGQKYNILSSNYSYIKGDVIKFTRTARFIKKESGWKIEGDDGLRGYTLNKFNY